MLEKGPVELNRLSPSAGSRTSLLKQISERGAIVVDLERTAWVSPGRRVHQRIVRTYPPRQNG